jgi:ribosome maturation factor RimP
MEPTGEIEGLINPILEQMGFRVVRVKFFARPRRTLQVMAERADGSTVIVDDCAAISRAISTALEVEDPIRGAYDLEVSSTGIDRPLVRIEDFVRFIGFEAQLTVDPPVEGQKRFRGRLVGADDDRVTMTLEGGAEVVLPFADIAEAKLAMTDELIAATMPPVNDA